MTYHILKTMSAVKKHAEMASVLEEQIGEILK